MYNKNKLHEQLVTDSWQRCRDFGLQHDTAPELYKLQNADARILLESHRSLIKTTDHAVLPYYDNILGKSPCLILLTDREGQVLNSWGEKRFLSSAQTPWFNTGSSWQEASAGTNAIGTALAIGQAVQIERDEHFLKRHRYMIGSASPIFDVNNELIGVLDISSDTYMPQAHTLGMVRLMAQSIENRLIVDKYSKDHYILTLNSHADNLDSQWSGLLVINPDGKIVSFNRRAELLLNYDLVHSYIENIVDCNVCTLSQHSKKSSFALRVLDKYTMYARLQEPSALALSRYSVAPLVASHSSLPSCLGFEKLEFGDPKFKKAIEQGKKIIEKDIPILIYGETGVGKEVFVKALHKHSSRNNKELMALNCAAIPADLVESQLFGYVKGAFTGADSKGSIGLIRKADKGILFLDEIGDMPLSVQGRLLRVLQERKVTPLGSTESYPVDVKLISATNCHLKTLVQQGTFRKDLFYRVSGLNIELPTLQNRLDKQPLLANIIASKCEGAQTIQLHPDIMTLFVRHPWPGNIRQFISVLEIALAMADGEMLKAEHLPDDFFDDLNDELNNEAAKSTDIGFQNEPHNMLSNTFDEEFDKELRAESVQINEQAVDITEPVGQGLKISDQLLQGSESEQTVACYHECNKNVSQAALALGVSRNTLYKRLRGLGLK
jgi:transcriptional regulator of acetoin/glycerol metabolism